MLLLYDIFKPLTVEFEESPSLISFFEMFHQKPLQTLISFILSEFFTDHDEAF